MVVDWIIIEDLIN